MLESECYNPAHYTDTNTHRDNHTLLANAFAMVSIRPHKHDIVQQVCTNSNDMCLESNDIIRDVPT